MRNLLRWHEYAHPTWALLVALWMTGGVSAQSVAELSGSVTDATGLPLTDVTITIKGPLNESARTNIAGQFTFPRLVEGVYELTAVSSGFYEPDKSFESRMVKRLSSLSLSWCSFSPRRW